MKRILLGLLMLACLSSATAETEGYWTNNADWYYHLSRYCGGAEAMVPISLDGAAAFEKHPCPVCVTVGDADIRGAIESTAELWVARIPESWLEAQTPAYSEGYSYAGDKSFAEDEMYRALGEYLRGENLARFLNDYRTSGRAEAIGWTPSNSLVTGYCPLLSRRLMNGTWYYIMKPGVDLKNQRDVTWKIKLDLLPVRLSAEDGLLICDGIGFAALQNCDLKFSVQDAEIVLEQTVGDQRIRVERIMDEYMLLLLRDAQKDPLTEDEIVVSTLMMEIGETFEIELFSFVEAERYHLYSCMLTEPEFLALSSGAEVKLRTESIWKPDYFDTPYAHTFDGDHYIIVDREGNIVREFDDHTIVHREASDRSFVIEQNSDTFHLDGWTLEQIE